MQANKIKVENYVNKETVNKMTQNETTENHLKQATATSLKAEDNTKQPT